MSCSTSKCLTQQNDKPDHIRWTVLFCHRFNNFSIYDNEMMIEIACQPILDLHDGIPFPYFPQ